MSKYVQSFLQKDQQTTKRTTIIISPEKKNYCIVKGQILQK